MKSPRTFYTLLSLVVVLTLTLSATGVWPAYAATLTVTFSNTGAITVPTAGPATATPYPSTINVAGLGGTVQKVTVTLHNFSHSFPEDVNVLLVGPGGQHTMLMSDVGYGIDAVNLTFTFDDAASSTLPCEDAPLASGTYQPIDCPEEWGNEAFPSPAPAGPYTASLAVFNDSDPNGDWNLYVYDDTNGDDGEISGGWSLTLELDTVDVTLNQASGQADPTNVGPINFTAAFSEPIDTATFTVADVTLGGTAPGTLSAVITQVAPNDGTTFNIEVSGMTGSGTVTASIAANTVQNLAGNGNMPSTSTDNSVTYDTSPTVVSSLRADANPTTADSVNFIVTFSEDVTGVDVGDFDLVTSGLSGASVSGVSGSGSVYTVTVSTGTGSGMLQLTVPASAAITDSGGNALSDLPFTSGESYTIDTIAPTVISGIRADANPTTADSVDFSVTFSEDVTGVDVGDFDLVTSGLSGAFVTGVSGSGSVYTVTVSTGSGSGTIQLIVPDLATISDSLGNALGGLPFTSGETYTIDRTAPTVVSSLRADASPTTADSVNFSVTFSEDVTGVDAADFDLVTSGVSGAAVSGVSGSGSVYTVIVSTGSGLGDIQLTIPASATITDGVGNALSSAFTSGESYEIGMSVYLPLVVNNFVSAPDLVVDSMSATGSQVTVTISNQGNAPAVDAFWVDVYLNPTTAPTGVNQPWPDLGSQGLVWGIEGAALPLDPGQSLTLTIGDSYYWPDLSSFSTPLSAGASVYAQVDSANAQTSYGGVLESHEISGGFYNNISGPVLSLAGGVGFALPSGGLPAPVTVTGSSLPPRD